MQPKQM